MKCLVDDVEIKELSPVTSPSDLGGPLSNTRIERDG
jgi:hypothetical protein